ncbi:MAG: hypothetical protein FJ395_17345 [Verrucomicrobia bacterium]|nr:hypothetical protein [Verrucomicrobiota bacterium]
MNLLAIALAIATTPLVPEYSTIIREEPVACSGNWLALHQATVTATQGIVRIVSTGHDPYVRMPSLRAQGPLVVRWRMRTTAQGPAQFFWTTTDNPHTTERQSAHATITSDGQWHNYTATLHATGIVTMLRFDPCTTTGVVEIADVRIARVVHHPLQFESLTAIRNASTNDITFTYNHQTVTARAGETVKFDIKIATNKPFTPVTFTATSANLPPLTHTIHWHNPFVETDWTEHRGRNVLVRVAKDNSGARFFWKGKLLAIATPLPPQFSVRLDGDEIVIKADAPGVFLRALGPLEQGLLCGVEHLGKGEASSTKLDLEGPQHLRYEPDPLLLTMPLAAFVTDRGSVAMLWDDTSLQPVFSTPNRYDSTDDHLMGVKGKRVTLRIRLGDSTRLEDAILWAVRERGLPSLPKPPRSPAAQRELILACLNGPMRDTNGWFHAKWGDFKANWFCDQASTIWRLTGTMPDVPKLVPHGAHIENWSAYFVTGRAKQWLDMIRARDAALIRQQKPDGSYRYDGKFRRGHFEDTASGWCAQHALRLLSDARFTGDANTLAAGVKTLEFMKRFRTPRGAQVWEISLHTPDILASAHLVHAYVLGYELTGRAEYLELARRWALSGLPFVYQWGRYPVQKYGTIAVLGSTNWQAPCWIGLPVQWCGLSYAYALTMLAPHDRTLDWKQIAEGILIAGEQMQWPDGPNIGCLPDYFEIAMQQRPQAPVNPCVLAALRLRLAGELDSLAVAADAKHRVVAPFPVRLRAGKAIITARRGLKYEVLVDGARIVPVTSRGTDVLDLERP